MAKTVLVITYPENPFVTRMWLKGFARYARASKWQVQTVTYGGVLRQRKSVVELIRYFRPDGIAAATFEGLSADIFGQIPHVWMDAPASKIPSGDSLVSHDGSETANLAARELLRLGLVRFAVVGDQPYRDWSRKRIRAFVEHIKDTSATMEVFELKTPAVNKVTTMKPLEPWLRSLAKPCGIFAVNDLIASEVIAVANRLGLRIPDDIAVVGVDNDVDICELTTPTLTSIATDWEKGGFLVAETLDRVMRNPNAKPLFRTFGELGIIRRASTTVGATRVDPRISEASAFIRAHACEGIGVDDVVRQMGCSRSLAMMRYLKATGRSIFAEIREVQFAQVLVLLSRRDLQLGAIADRCGWKSPTALRTYFEKRLGMTMREWRNRNAAS